MKLVVVSQNGCSPCKSVKNFLNDESVDFKEFNITKDDSVEIYDKKFTASDLSIMATPITILFDEDAEEIARVAGFEPQQLQVLIDQLQ